MANKTNEPHVIIGKKSISHKERETCAEVLRSELLSWSSSKRKWTGVARGKDERNNMGLGG